MSEQKRGTFKIKFNDLIFLRSQRVSSTGDTAIQKLRTTVVISSPELLDTFQVNGINHTHIL